MTGCCKAKLLYSHCMLQRWQFSSERALSRLHGCMLIHHVFRLPDNSPVPTCVCWRKADLCLSDQSWWDVHKWPGTCSVSPCLCSYQCVIVCGRRYCLLTPACECSTGVWGVSVALCCVFRAHAWGALMKGACLIAWQHSHPQQGRWPCQHSCCKHPTRNPPLSDCSLGCRTSLPTLCCRGQPIQETRKQPN